MLQYFPFPPVTLDFGPTPSSNFSSIDEFHDQQGAFNSREPGKIHSKLSDCYQGLLIPKVQASGPPLSAILSINVQQTG
jgi:hypothetical protein